MTRVSLSKMSLQKERENLRLYERILPSLDLKRLQLTGALARARAEAEQGHEAVRRGSERAARKLPMMANRGINLSKLVKVTAIRQETENLLGVELPMLKEVAVRVTPYSLIGTPPWMDVFVETLTETLRLKAEARIADRRVALLSLAVRRVTQRINLFEKILIPRAKENIKRIRIYLGDMERAAIVRAKIAKTKRLGTRVASAAEEIP